MSEGQPPRVATPWGRAVLVEEVWADQTAGAARFRCGVQLLEAEDGGRLVRLVYSSGGSARRGPVTLRAADIDALATALQSTAELRRALSPLTRRTARTP